MQGTAQVSTSAASLCSELYIIIGESTNQPDPEVWSYTFCEVSLVNAICPAVVMQRMLSLHLYPQCAQRHEQLSVLKWADIWGLSGRKEGRRLLHVQMCWSRRAGTDAHSRPLWLMSRRLVLQGKVRWRGKSCADRREENKLHLWLCSRLAGRLVLKSRNPLRVLAGTATCWWAAWVREWCWSLSVPLSGSYLCLLVYSRLILFINPEAIFVCLVGWFISTCENGIA